MISFALDFMGFKMMGFKMIYWTPISGSYFLKESILEKCGIFRADMAGLGKYCTGGYGRIGVYRVNIINK